MDNSKYIRISKDEKSGVIVIDDFIYSCTSTSSVLELEHFRKLLNCNSKKEALYILYGV